MNRDSKILILGHHGLVGSALVRLHQAEGYTNVVTPVRRVDLREQSLTRELFAELSPEYVYLAAAKVGGIVANSSYPADFAYDNIMIAANTLDACRRSGVKKVLMLGSTCIYPKLAPQPIREDSLLSGPLEPSNQWYATAKIAGIKMGQAFHRQYGMNVISAMPTNLYGPNDNFDLQTSHVMPALIRKMHEAKSSKADHVVIWGTGTPRREFLHVDDMARACLLLMREYEQEEIINIGCGEDIPILELAQLIKEIVGFEGELRFDTSKPDGTPRKITDSSRMFNLGWKPQIGLADGIRQAYKGYCERLVAAS